MKSTVSEIAPDIYRLSFFDENANLQYNQFLIRDDEPMLLHTGMKRMFPSTLEAVASLIDPKSLRWIGFSHVEADECGALNEWLQVAAHAQAACSFLGVMVNMHDQADRLPRALDDGETIQTGRRRIRFLTTPHVPHCWDAGLFYEETGSTLFCSDLFLQTGNQRPLTDSDVLGKVRDDIITHLAGPWAHDIPYTPRTDGVLHRLAALEPTTLAIMHGSSYSGDGALALRELTGILRETLGGFPLDQRAAASLQTA